ncbi:hypothetical protein GGH96_003096 [Coemansia sp. RSA 1972]|nr:hypothetical protein GGH96_003096 [Coemansia sp. RSA 1972]
MALLCPSSEGWGPLSPSRPIDFTTCFEHDVLVMGINVLFLVVAVVRLRTLRHAPLLPRTLVSGSLFWAKLSLAVATLTASVAELAFVTYAYSSVCVFTVSMGLQTFAAVVAVCLHYCEQLRNRIASTPLLLFWLATVLLALMRLRTTVSMERINIQPAAVVANTLFMLAALATLALECQPKPHGLYQLLEDDEDNFRFQSPEERANVFSRWTFTWLTPLLEQGFRKPLQMEDVWDLSRQYQPDVAKAEFQRNWQAEQQRSNPSLFRATMRTYGAVWMLGGFYKLVKDLLDFAAIFSHIMWSSPLQIVLVLFLLYRTLGWTVYAGVLAMLISISMSAQLSRSMGALNKLLMGYRDQRMKIMDEVLSGIKIIKLYAWESSFIRRINEVRVKLELRTIRHYGMLQAVFSFAISFSVFGLYSLADNVSHGPLTPQLVFVSLTLFNMLRFPLSVGPMVIPSVLEAMVSSRRIFAAIEREPYDRDASNTTADDVLVSVENGTFKWLSADAPTLHGVSVQCKRDELVAVIGKVGAGKSSLVSAILGDMIKCDGSVRIRGSIAYVPQQAWIMNATLRDNIMFGSQFDQEFYDRVIDACALRPDLDMLPAGDMRDWREGQAHLYPCLGPQGMLKTRARILVTNAVQYLSNVANIVMLKDGAVVDQGLFAQAMAQQSSIFEFIHKYIDKTHSSQATSNTASDSEYVEDETTQTEQDGMVLPKGVGIRRKSTKETLGRASVGIMHVKRGVLEAAVGAEQGRTITTEVSRQGHVEWSTYYTYVKACGLRNALTFTVVLLLASVSSVCANMWLKHWASSNAGTDINLGPFMWSKSWSPSSADADPSSSQFYLTAVHSVFYYLFIYSGLGLLGALLSSLQSLLLWTRCSIRTSAKIHQNMFISVLRSPMSFFDVTPLGRILNRFSSDLQCCDEVLPRSVSSMVNTTVNVVSAVVVIILSTPLVLVLMLPLTIAYSHIQQLYLSSSRKLWRLDSTTRSPIFAHFQESIGGVSTIRAYNQQPRFIYENEFRIGQNMRAYCTYFSLNRWLSLRLETLGNMVMLSTALLAIGSVHYFGYGDAGQIGLSIMYALVITNSVNGLVRSYTDVENSMIQLERVVEYAELSSEAPEVIEDRRPVATWPNQGMIEFKDYSTRYREGLNLVLKELSFRVLPNQKVGIVGCTGAGKSSLTLALFCIIGAASGQILIDGEDIAKYGLFDVRRKLSIIPQDPVLFAGTVRKNLDPFNSYSDQEIWQALEHAHLADFIRAKDERLEFMVLQSCENFSVSQRQLICLARALLKRTKVLVLDEATAAIGHVTDTIIQKSIRKEFKNCTVLTIAHRLDTIIDSDMILVVDGGRLVEYDTPQNLLENKNSLFAKLVEEARATSSQ